MLTQPENFAALADLSGHWTDAVHDRRLMRPARYAGFQFAEAALPRAEFAGIVGLINGLRRPWAQEVSA